jgi:hypothetical protein
LEENHGLDVEADSHIWLLHHLFLQHIEHDALQWSKVWNEHPMRLPQGQRNGQSPRYMFVHGMIQNGIRGLEAIDREYDEDPEHYGVDWEDLDNPDLTLHRIDPYHQADQNRVFSHSAPPRWSRVTIDPPAEVPLTAAQVTEMDAYIDRRVGTDNLSMDKHRRRWTLALQYATHLRPE